MGQWTGYYIQSEQSSNDVEPKPPPKVLLSIIIYFYPYILASPQLQQLWKRSFLLLASNEWTLILFLLCVCNTDGALLKINTFHSEWSLQLDIFYYIFPHFQLKTVTSCMYLELYIPLLGLIFFFTSPCSYAYILILQS